MEKIGIGFIGFGYWTPILHRNIKKFSDFNVVAFCEKDESRHKNIESQVPGAKIYKHYEEMFMNPEINAVIVGASVSAHFRIAKLALQHGKHVFIEKPMTTSVAHARELVNIAEKKNLILMVDHTYIYSPAIQKLAEIIKSGKLGNVFYFDSVRANLGLFQWDTSVLWDLAPHDFSVLLYSIKERPTHVSAFGASPLVHPKQQGPVESFIYINVFFPSGLIAHFHISWMWPVKTRRITVVGSEKMAVYDQLDKEGQVKIFDKNVKPQDPKDDDPTLYPSLFKYKDGEAEILEVPSGEDLEFVLGDFLNSIKNGEKPLSDGSFGVDVIRMITATEKSIKRGGKKTKI